MVNLKLVLIDIDGCLIAGEGKPFDFEALACLAGLNRCARGDRTKAAVTLCTGRPEPYVEALMQAIDGFLPAIYENGAGLYFPSPYRFIENPAITFELHAEQQEIRRLLRKALVEPGIGQFQPGKETTVTLYPAREGVTLAEVAELARATLEGHVKGYAVHAALTSVEILPHGIDKGTGVEWLARETGIALEEMAGIGDAPGDLPFLDKVGFSAAPANAPEEVKRRVMYVSPYKDSRGVMDILRNLGSKI